MGLRDFLKKAQVEEDESGWRVGDEEEEGVNINLDGAFKAIKELKRRGSQ